jgi:hypothetical protein
MAQNRKTRKERGKLRATDDEWHRITMAAQKAGRPVLRYVREAALGAPPAPRRTAGVDAVVLALTRVQTNLRQLQTIADVDGDEHWSSRIGATADAVDRAFAALPAAYDDGVAEHLVAEISRAGVALNVLARQANTDEELPPDHALDVGLRDVEAVLPAVGVTPR